MSTRYERDERVLWRGVSRGIVLLGPDATDAVVVTGSGAALWDELSAPSTSECVANALAGRFSVPMQEAGPVVEAVLAQLLEQGLVRTVPCDEPW